ncbi:hypothetical protein DPSP01_000137 [Paraphaeosphaeria sporulosa]|uniref:Arrestin-like N-terminal domain-containing protein n=1 Tax=Paraphaeosphaeria sporulosa TaxID=1460663 RepID=A0A177CZK2_9PLEO|nr:uncharacterized protein CC84DRAFT_166163 [Paraphaeosphaeria sporulosa]OAG12935.1 hypothetical protein CC84DRAFT_166163 [Paraphaeosphaeria sporulosa]
MVPDLRILVDGDARVYRRGDKVTGRVILGVEHEEDVVALKISFSGVCITTTNRPVYTPHRADATAPMQRYQERVQLFKFEQDLLSGSELASNKESRTFDFKFPELTVPRFSKWQHGPKYLKSPHPLPPSFQTDTSGGQAVVAYCLRATLVRGGSHRPLETQEMLPYHPTPDNIQLEPQAHSRVLYAQIWKPLSDSRTAMDKAMSKLSRRSSSATGPRIVPTLHHPETIAPGQNIPLYLSLEDASPAPNFQASQCTLDCVTVKISTHTTSMCGQSATSPEDIECKRVTCLSKSNLAKPLPFNTKAKLAHNFRLLEDTECVPSFKTYTITRRYDLSVSVGLKYEGREFTVRCTTLLEILPRVPRDLLPGVLEEEEEDEPLPPYAPREPSREFAPMYESIFMLEQESSSETSLAYTTSRGSSTTSNMSTPASEVEGMSFGEAAVSR